MQTIKSFLKIFSWQTLIVTILAVTATYLSDRYGYQAKFPLTLIGIAVVFPLVFSINSAYKRREIALNHYGVLKSFGRAIYFANRDWIENPAKDKLDEIKLSLGNFFSACNSFFHSTGKIQTEQEEIIYSCFRKLSIDIKGFRAQGMSGSEVSRANQHLSKMFVAFEQLKHIYQYRTPVALRAYSKIYIFILPIIYGPYFATVKEEGHPSIMFVLPALFSMILVSLDNIQEHLENPFDKLGEDDIYINSDKFIKSLDL